MRGAWSCPKTGVNIQPKLGRSAKGCGGRSLTDEAGQVKAEVWWASNCPAMSKFLASAPPPLAFRSWHSAPCRTDLTPQRRQPHLFQPPPTTARQLRPSSADPPDTKRLPTHVPHFKRRSQSRVRTGTNSEIKCTSPPIPPLTISSILSLVGFLTTHLQYDQDIPRQDP